MSEIGSKNMTFRCFCLLYAIWQSRSTTEGVSFKAKDICFDASSCKHSKAEVANIKGIAYLIFNSLPHAHQWFSLVNFLSEDLVNELRLVVVKRTPVPNTIIKNTTALFWHV
jgi:hypothetical protein